MRRWGAYRLSTINENTQYFCDDNAAGGLSGADSGFLPAQPLIRVFRFHSGLGVILIYIHLTRVITPYFLDGIFICSSLRFLTHNSLYFKV